MTPFLTSVASKYIEHEANNLVDYCFVFPNKRSGVFFEKYLSEYINRPILLPKIVTISDLISVFSESIDASRYEQLFILYNAYKSLSSEVTDFDQFQFWGDMILNDFNDVDKYLVDAKQLFANVRHIKEIGSTYLTPEQIEIINKYWGENRSIESVDKFWTHLDNHLEDKQLPRDKFLKLWEILYELYVKFNTELTNKGLSYSGRSYRNAAKNISKLTIDQLSFKRYIFVGFNVLSTAEIKILDRLKDLGCADFYWDFNPLSYLKENNKATRFIKKYAKLFPSRYNIDDINDLPQINIIGIPSNVGQVKEASTILTELATSGKINDITNALNTAIVLPDENLFIPLIHSFPEQFKTVNITMGYPLKYTPISALINVIVSMHLRARIIKGDYVFYFEDVQAVLSQPLIRAVANWECDQINNLISNKRIFNLSAKQLINDYPHLAALFSPVKDIQCFNDVFEYTFNLIEFLKECISNSPKSSLDVMFLARYQQALQELKVMVENYNIKMKEHTFFHLIERAVSSEKVNFEGEPLKGLQIMGVLETRALDFENLIILSMNERIFPRKHYVRSFIPESLRHGYAMSTLEFQESIYAYYFYRLLTRSKNVYLLYDARTSGVKSGEMSRYLYQLKYLYPHSSIKFHITDYDIHPIHTEHIEIEKTPDVLKKLNRFISDDPNEALSLSASTIKTYVKCPLQFYLKSVERLNIKDEVKEYMDDATYGSIVHSVIENIYKSKGNAIIYESDLNDWANNEIMLSKEITRAINEHYNKLGKDCYTELYGEVQVLANVIKHSIKNLFYKEHKYAPIKFISAEERMTGKYTISENLSINIKLFIDRIDKVSVDNKDLLRIIDYKTGSDQTSITSFEELFDNSISNNNGAILQMFIYCNFYSALKNYNEAIQPIIYKLRTLNTNGLAPITIGDKRKKQKIQILDYREHNDEFIKHFHKSITEMFDPKIPFRQTQNDDNCKYCNFKNICGK